MKQINALTRTIGIHGTLILTILITSVPFYWAAQTSIKLIPRTGFSHGNDDCDWKLNRYVM